jgi:hypothetical protein
MTTRAEVEAKLNAALAAATAASVAATEAEQAAEASTAAVLAAADAIDTYTPEEPAPGPTPEPDPSGTRFGIYPGADAKDWAAKVAAFEQRTGIDVVQVGGNQDQRTEGARGSVAGVAASNVPVKTLTCAIQLAFTGDPYGDTQGRKAGAIKRAALTATITGRNDAIYEANAAALKASSYEQIILRLGSEGDIAWPPHSFIPGSDGGRANDDAYREAWSHVHAIFDGELGDRARYSYTSTMRAASTQITCADGRQRSPLEAGYPGDPLVDIIGIDCYLGQPLTAVKGYTAGCLTFAKAHGKPAALDEWGINETGLKLPAGEQCDYVRWVASLPLEYGSFFAGWAAVTWPDDYPATTRTCLVDAFTAS